MSCIWWSSTRPIRLKAEKAVARAQKTTVDRGEADASSPWTTHCPAIRRTWLGKARRNICAEQADSCSGCIVKLPVTGCIAISSSASLRSRSCSFVGASTSCTLSKTSFAGGACCIGGLGIGAIAMSCAGTPRTSNSQNPCQSEHSCCLCAAAGGASQKKTASRAPRSCRLWAPFGAAF
jgi:hypothetical protein